MSPRQYERGPVRLWADLARAGNFPSVASNVLAALVLSSAVSEWPPLALLLWAWLAGGLAYAGGATLNDVADVRFDQSHRPDRPIASGDITRSAAAVLGIVQLLSGAALLLWLGCTWYLVVALVVVIAAYDGLHKHWSGSVMLMGGCRLLLALALATTPGHELQAAVLWWASGLFVYIVGLSLLARREHRPGAAARPRLGPIVGQLLAMMPLVDAFALTLVGAWGPALACAMAYPLGRLAQRLAAST